MATGRKRSRQTRSKAPSKSALGLPKRCDDLEVIVSHYYLVTVMIMAVMCKAFQLHCGRWYTRYQAIIMMQWTMQSFRIGSTIASYQLENADILDCLAVLYWIMHFNLHGRNDQSLCSE